ncbi:unnamed protein product [Rotaria sp. Silwood1]|nr:unnamed protein product [Rotaria sp. Silwood1]
MDTIKIEWKKQSGEAHILPNRQYTQQQSILKLDSQEKKPKKKKVQFKFRTSTSKVEAFENTEHNHSKTHRLQGSLFDDHDYASRSKNGFTTELVETDDKQTCSTRSKIVTTIIIMIIIVTVAIVIGVVVGVSKTQKSIVETTTINNQTSFSVSTTTLVSSISIGNQSGPPCSSYTTIDDPSRNIAQSSLYALCDRGSPFNTSNGGSWIRFIGTGGTILPLTAPAQGRCGAYMFRTSTPKVQAFENAKHTHSKTDRSQRSIFEEHDYTSRSTNSLTAELVETDDKQICSSRSKIITIIIVMIIILTVAVVVGVIVGVSKSQQSIVETTTIDNQTSLSTTTSVSSISIGNQSGPPCSSYTTIDDPSRNIAQSSLFGSCDNGSPFNASNDGSWIRFIGTGGTIIPLAAPAQGHCGAYVGGWFNGTLPTTVGTVANGT